MTSDPSRAIEDYLSLALGWLDLHIHREILRLRAGYQLSLDEFRGLYISDEQVDDLIRSAASGNDRIPDLDDIEGRISEYQATMSAHAPKKWTSLLRRFELDALDAMTLVAAIAPEIDLKYETLYGYLNNDVTRRHLTTDLVVRLFRGKGYQVARFRQTLSSDARLINSGLVKPVSTDNKSQSLLASGFAVNAAVIDYLFGLELFVRKAERAGRDRSRIADAESNLSPRLKRIGDLLADKEQAPVLIFSGATGTGRAAAAEYLARCADRPLLRVGAGELDKSADEADSWRSLMCRARLADALVEIEFPIEEEGGQARASLRVNRIREIHNDRLPLVLRVGEGFRWQPFASGTGALLVTFDRPDAARRQALWEQGIARQSLEADSSTLVQLAERFNLSVDQISDAVTGLFHRRRLEGNGSPCIPGAWLFAAARQQSHGEISNLAQRVTLKSGWDDLVLPSATLRRVREVANAIACRQRVYNDWGMGSRVNNPNGLTVMFAGTSGTGKTLTASVIAGEMGLDLYRVDLAGVVSKYIGETEKNLDRIFAAASNANAILFFDEAEALFGKRSETKDAHDRYANIEVAYLLQKMEEHDGVVVLATNLAKNLDQAFLRRLNFVVEFPRPDARLRELIWRHIFPSQTPLAEDMDFAFFAHEFNNTGGEIRTVALDAAFFAAQRGDQVTMGDVVNALARQMVKQGRAPAASEFKQYHEMIAREVH